MLNKKYIFLLLLSIVCICTLSAVSATDDVADVLATNEYDDALTVDETNADELATNFEEDLEKSIDETNEENIVDEEKLSVVEDDSKLTVDQSNNELSMIWGNYYSVDLSDTTIASNKQQTIKAYVTPSIVSGSYGYDFDFIVIDNNAKAVFSKHFSDTSTATKTIPVTIPKNTLAPGTYFIAAFNTFDEVLMDSAYLYVSGNAVIEANNYYSSYMSGVAMSGRITDQVTGKPISTMSVKVVFTKGSTTITKYYNPDSNGYFSFVPPVGVGTWIVSITPSAAHVGGSASKTATITKSKVVVKAKKVVEYKGFKAKLKATVKSNGKNVNEGKVQFKINGKKYNVNVKNGVATKKIKLKKIKKYKYTAKYLGNANLYKSKVSKAKAIMKKRQKVKITFKKPVVYTGQTKKIVVKIKSRGKYVKGGWLFIKSKVGVDKVKVKKGKITLYAYGSLADHYKGTNGIDKFYKKKVTKKYWLKYKPESHKYYAKKVNYKATSKFKCDLCGKKSTHYHYSYGYFVVYKYKIVVS